MITKGPIANRSCRFTATLPVDQKHQATPCDKQCLKLFAEFLGLTEVAAKSFHLSAAKLMPLLTCEIKLQPCLHCIPASIQFNADNASHQQYNYSKSIASHFICTILY